MRTLFALAGRVPSTGTAVDFRKKFGEKRDTASNHIAQTKKAARRNVPGRAANHIYPAL